MVQLLFEDPWMWMSVAGAEEFHVDDQVKEGGCVGWKWRKKEKLSDLSFREWCEGLVV